MADILAGLGGAFSGGANALEFLLRMREAQEARDEQQRRFDADMAYRQSRDTEEDRRFARGEIREDRQRREDRVIDQINKRGGSFIGDPSEAVQGMLPIRAGEPETAARAVGQFAPGIAPGMQSALEGARTARAEGAVTLARQLAEGRQRAQRTQQTQQVPGQPIVVDPNEIFNPAGMASVRSNEMIDDYRRRHDALAQANAFLNNEPAIALLKGDLFSLPADKQREASDALNRFYTNAVGFSRYYGVDPQEIVKLALGQHGIDPSIIQRVTGQGLVPDSGPKFSNPFGPQTGGGAEPRSAPAAPPSGGPQFSNPFAPPAEEGSRIRRSSGRDTVFTRLFPE